MDTNNAALQAWLPLIVILALWSGIWKAIALYKAGGKKDLAWFIVLFIVNTLGILEIFYIFYFGKNKKTSGRE